MKKQLNPKEESAWPDLEAAFPPINEIMGTNLECAMQESFKDLDTAVKKII